MCYAVVTAAYVKLFVNPIEFTGTFGLLKKCICISFHGKMTENGALTYSRRRSLSYRNQSIDLQSKSIDWFLYDKNLRHERVNYRMDKTFFSKS